MDVVWADEQRVRDYQVRLDHTSGGKMATVSWAPLLDELFGIWYGHILRTED